MVKHNIFFIDIVGERPYGRLHQSHNKGKTKKREKDYVDRETRSSLLMLDLENDKLYTIL